MNGFSEPLASHGAWEYDLAREEGKWSDAVYRIHGVAPGDVETVRDVLLDFVHPEDVEEFRRVAAIAVEAGTSFTVQHRIVRPDGVERTVVIRASMMRDSEDSPGRLIGTIQDVTGRPGFEERLWHLANEDSLTGLLNRRRLLEELAREVAVARRTHRPGAVLMLDLDRFKEVNDSLGHSAGDGLLRAVAAALSGRLRITDTLARLGGDEFAVVLPDCDAEQAQRVAHELGEALEAGPAIKIAGRNRPITASIGIAPFGSRAGETADTLIVEADLAMYRAKRSESGRIEVFDEAMRGELAAKLEVEAELREAIEGDQLRVVYQPITSVKDGLSVGFEALVRWQHPTRGLVSPIEFIPVAEEYDLIGPIGEIVLRRACEQAAEWRRDGRNLFVTVNVSPLQLVRADIVTVVRDVLEQSRLPAPLLCLEMTETALLDDARAMLPALSELRELGVRLAIDDFGGGSSSFALLRMLPIDMIKVDRVFIEGISERPDDRAIVAAVISLAEELDLIVVAEGVENERQHWELSELGCEFAQGFLYGRPEVPANLDLGGYAVAAQPGVGDPTQIREFMRQIGIPARIEQ